MNYFWRKSITPFYKVLLLPYLSHLLKLFLLKPADNLGKMVQVVHKNESSQRRRLENDSASRSQTPLGSHLGSSTKEPWDLAQGTQPVCTSVSFSMERVATFRPHEAWRLYHWLTTSISFPVLPVLPIDLLILLTEAWPLNWPRWSRSRGAIGLIWAEVFRSFGYSHQPLCSAALWDHQVSCGGYFFSLVLGWKDTWSRARMSPAELPMFRNSRTFRVEALSSHKWKKKVLN